MINGLPGNGGARTRLDEGFGWIPAEEGHFHGHFNPAGPHMWHIYSSNRVVNYNATCTLQLWMTRATQRNYMHACTLVSSGKKSDS